MGNWSFPGVEYGRGVLLTIHPFLVPQSWKSRAIPLPTFWATTGPVTGTLYLLPLLKITRGGQLLQTEGNISLSRQAKELHHHIFNVQHILSHSPTFAFRLALAPLK